MKHEWILHVFHLGILFSPFFAILFFYDFSTTEKFSLFLGLALIWVYKILQYMTELR